ncbi:threonine/serine ThrE exporter family protein [Ruicaihuangia caeni]|uniref:threonine/serine ThrE exporter family protein n=1 Tax=Ruicaihuangia caeni TaxID=3042517 RepID=UPI00338F0B81
MSPDSPEHDAERDDPVRNSARDEALDGRGAAEADRTEEQNAQRAPEQTAGVRRASQHLDLAAKTGAALLGSTAPAMEVVDAMLDIVEHGGVDHVDVDVTYSQITLTHRPRSGPHSVELEHIRARTFDYGRYVHAEMLVQRFLSGELELDDALAQAGRLRRDAHRYPWWLTRLAAGTAGVTAAVIFGAGWITAVFAFIANVMVDWLFARLSSRAWPVFFTQAFAGVIAVAAAAGVNAISPEVDSSQVVVSVIIMMLAGMTSTGGVHDLITGWYLTGVGRLAEGVVNTVGLVVGIQIGIALAHGAGAALTITPEVRFGADPLLLTALTSAALAVCFGVWAQLPPRSFPLAALLSLIGWVLFGVAIDRAVDPVWASGIAAVVIGLASPVAAQLVRVPSWILASVAIVPLLPGVALYRGLFAGADGDVGTGMLLLLSALGTALVLASGITLGQYLTAALLRGPFKLRSRFVPQFLGPFSTSRERIDRLSEAHDQEEDERSVD